MNATASPGGRSFNCRRCGSAISVASSELGAAVQCAQCGATFTLMPRPASVEALLDDELTAAHPDPAPLAAEPVPDVAKQLLVRDAEVYTEHGKRFERRTKPAGPRFVFWSGLLTFPFYPATLTHYLAMTLAWVLILLFIQFATYAFVFLSLGSIIMFFTATSLAVTLAAHSAACCMGVIVETADAVDEVHEWPDMNWREWFPSLFPPGFSLALSASIGYCFVMLFEIDSFLPAVAIAAVLFPFFLLSAIEADSFMPLSPVVFRSLTGVTWAWLVFYAEWGLLVVGSAWLVVEVTERYGTPGTVALAPLVAAALLIGSRLLGRLGWCVAKWMERRMAEADADEQ